jgi:hypothetical protein
LNPPITYYLPSAKYLGGAAEIRKPHGATVLSFPQPEGGWLGEIAGDLRARCPAAAARPISEILGVLDSLNARWSDSTSPERRQADALLKAVTDYPAAVITPALDHLFAGLRSTHLEATMREEIGDPEALDHWIERRALGTKSRAFGPGLTVIVASGNVPMAAIPSVVYSLLMKSPVLVKLSSDEPVLAGLYLRSLAAADEALGRTCAAVWWPGGDEAIEAAVLAHAEAVIAFGGESTLRSLSAKLPSHARFQPHGHRIGFAIVGRERLTAAGLPAVAEAAARDVAEFDQQGCVAPQRLFVERGGKASPETFGRAVAAALGVLAAEWPRSAPAPAASAAIHQLRAAASVRSALQPEVGLWSSAGGTDWTVILDPECGFGPGCLYRTLVIHPVDDLAEVASWIAPYSEYLQTAAVAASEARHTPLAENLGRLGVPRVGPLGRAPRPAAGWRADGRPRLADLVRWLDWEAS